MVGPRAGGVLTLVLQKHLDAAATIGGLLRTSLGPAGRCKMVVDPTGEFHITRDGYTLMTQMDFKVQAAVIVLVDYVGQRHPIGRLLVGLVESQQAVAADGTTTVVVLAGVFVPQWKGLRGRLGSVQGVSVLRLLGCCDLAYTGGLSSKGSRKHSM